MRIKTLWDHVKNKFIQKSDKVLGIDIGTGSLKIIELNFKNERPVVTKLAIADFSENLFEDGRLVKPDELTSVLQHQLSTGGFSSREAVIAIGGRAIFIREVVFPQMAEDELQEAIKWDMEKYVPYAPDSFYYDFSIIGTANNGLEMRVLLVAAPKYHIDSLVSVLKLAGLKPIAVDGEAFALYRSIVKAENSILVDIGQYMSQIIVYQQGIPTVTRIIPLAGQRFTEVLMNALDLDVYEAERLKQRQQGLLPAVNHSPEHTDIHKQMLLLVQELAREIRRTVEFYQVQNKEAIIEKIIISGGGANLDNLIQHLKTMLDIPILQHNPADIVEYAASYDHQYIKDIGPRIAAAVGLALRGGQR
ncbi:type IV pilus assembly protein PilM [bacterium BFN5]|nr:type IV pilus assembly protein PilM [bacterium BFN5]